MPAKAVEIFIKLSDYLGWAHDEGCTIRTGFIYLESGEMQSFTAVISPEGRRVVILDTDPEERLPYSVYKSYDRRLGLSYVKKD
jgi:hypothetical protein